jgi:hypothetical protein
MQLELHTLSAAFKKLRERTFNQNIEHRLAMDAYECTDHVKLICAGHA